MKRYILYLSILSTALTTSSCKKDGCTDELANNYNAEADNNDGSCTYAPQITYTVPSTYTFTDASGNSTVSYSGQTIRLEMLEEMTNYMKTANTLGVSVAAQDLKDMYDDNDGTGFSWTDAEGHGMAASGKQLKNKTAQNDPAIQQIFEDYMDSIAVMSQSSMAGSAGTAGVVESNDGTKKYLFSPTGIEYTQYIEKGLMAAVFYNQISDVYLGSDKMNVDNTTAVDPGNGKYYTVMEHHWDEAYGYFTSAVDYPTNGADRFWGKYANSREGLLGSATAISDAFRRGRAAISNDDLTERDAQIAIIRTELERVLAATAIHYLNGAVDDITDDALRNHQLSEAVAFIEGLAYGHAPSISSGQISTILSTIGNDFYNVTAQDLTSARDQLSTIFNMDDIKNQL